MSDEGNGRSLSGVLLTAFGGPHGLEDVGEFMASLMGREPSAELVERARRKYLTIGGKSPLPEIAADLVEGLHKELASGGFDVPVAVGMRYWTPWIAESVAWLAEVGVRRVVMVPLSPFESKVSTGAYREAVKAAVAEHPGMEVVEAAPYNLDDRFVTMLADEADYVLSGMPQETRKLLVFTAHSLPLSDLVDDDPYVRDLRATVEAVADRSALPEGSEGEVPFMPGVATLGSFGDGADWLLAYQSKGAKPGEWLGPDLVDVIEAAAGAGYEGIAVSPVGFVTDHMETLFDIDVVAAGKAVELDLEFERTAVPNADERMLKVLSAAVTPLL